MVAECREQPLQLEKVQTPQCKQAKMLSWPQTIRLKMQLVRHAMQQKRSRFQLVNRLQKLPKIAQAQYFLLELHVVRQPKLQDKHRRARPAMRSQGTHRSNHKLTGSPALCAASAPHLFQHTSEDRILWPLTRQHQSAR